MKRRRRRREERGTDHHDRTVIHTQNLQIQTKYVYLLYAGNVHSFVSIKINFQRLPSWLLDKSKSRVIWTFSRNVSKVFSNSR